ncbi:hypothetical protein D9757_002314 [Collybiopsis confluens]|uniref:Uncharacterized protein n=1 Tax=Collybiopsis confluens TaxID=2823264 RepID=A0A8H5MG15_9AGAR|nr:hypothetical protein D9757_002314 [Collybiopsis confluens]
MTDVRELLLTPASTWSSLSVQVTCTSMAAVAELGLVSNLLHKGGNIVTAYPSAEFKHILGLLLFTCIASLLYIIGHSFMSMGLNIFATFALAVFWGTSAGVIFHVSPFESYTCDKPRSIFNSNWESYAENCAVIVAMQGLAWALCKSTFR